MAKKFLHRHSEFKDLLEILAGEMNIAAVLVEKDYWVMHALWGLKEQGFKIELKGGTSLSKGYNIIHRFSEDLDIKIEPPSNEKVFTGKNQDEKKHIESRRKFFDGLAKKLSIPDMRAVRDTEFDDTEGKMRGAGIRLTHDSSYLEVAGLKNGVLLEVGFDTTQPSQPCEISSWTWDRANKMKIELIDNRAKSVSCYHPGYTFVEKLQTVLSRFKKYEDDGILRKNFLRHYYDIYQLLENPAVQEFIGTPAYKAHKKLRFKSLDNDLTKTEAFSISDSRIFKQFDKQYKSTGILYFKGQPDLRDILDRIQTRIVEL